MKDVDDIGEEGTLDSKTINRAIGQRLRESRQKQGKLQKELAIVLGVEFNHYNHIENGVKGCTLTNLIKLCNFLEVSPDVILQDVIHLPECESENIEEIYNSLSLHYKRIAIAMLKCLKKTEKEEIREY